MWSTICFNLNQSRILSSGKGLMHMQKNIDSDQHAQTAQADLSKNISP